MKLIAISFLLICFSYSVAQEIPDKFRIYKTKVRLLDERKSIHGIFYSLNDTSIVLGNMLMKTNYYENNFETVNIPIENIKRLSVRRKGKEGRSIVTGLGIGALFGVILGYSSGDWDSEPQYHPDSEAYFFGTAFGIFGAGIGAIVGMPSAQYRINGDQNSYVKYREKLNKYAIIKE